MSCRGDGIEREERKEEGRKEWREGGADGWPQKCGEAAP